jgi:hypothetical protein
MDSPIFAESLYFGKTENWPLLDARTEDKAVQSFSGQLLVPDFRQPGACGGMINMFVGC